MGETRFEVRQTRLGALGAHYGEDVMAIVARVGRLIYSWAGTVERGREIVAFLEWIDADYEIL